MISLKCVLRELESQADKIRNRKEEKCFRFKTREIIDE